MKSFNTSYGLRSFLGKGILFGMLAIAFSMPTLSASGVSAFPDPLAVPDQEQGHLTLRKTGESGRKVLIFPLYRIAHYMDGVMDRGSVLDYRGPKAVQMQFEREIGGMRIREEVFAAIQERVSPRLWEELKESAEAFCKPYKTGSVRKGDVFSVVWFEDGSLVSRFNGEEICRVKDPIFARALWSIWVGDQSLVDSDDLLAALSD